MKTLKLVTFAISCWHRSKKCSMISTRIVPCVVGEHVQRLQPWFQQILIIFDIYSTRTVQRHEMCPFEPIQAQPRSQKGLDKTQKKKQNLMIGTTKYCLLYAPESPVWNAPRLAGSLVTANGIMVGSFTSMLGWGSPLCETHDYIKDITTSAQEEFVRLLSVNTVCSHAELFTFFSASQLFGNQGCGTYSW